MSESTPPDTVVFSNVGLPCSICSTIYKVTLLNCSQCGRLICRSCVDRAFAPTGTASATIFAGVRKAVKAAKADKGPMPRFCCHICWPLDSPPESLLQQMVRQEVVSADELQNLDTEPSAIAYIPQSGSTPVKNTARELNTSGDSRLDDALSQSLAALNATMQRVADHIVRENRSSRPPETAGTPAILPRSVLKNLTLPTFDGNDINGFHQFWAAFRLRVDQAAIPDVDKLETLRALLSGAALRKIEALDPTVPDSYQTAKRTLEDHYADTQHQKAAALHSITHLPTLISEDYSTLEDFSDTLRTACAHLRRLSMTDDTLDTYVYIVLPRLPTSLQDELRNHRARNGMTLVPSMEELLKYIATVLRARRTAQKVNSPTVYTGSALAGAAPPPCPQQMTCAESTASLPVRNSNRRRVTCLYCEGEHQAIVCTRVTDPKARLDIIRSQNRCRNCLGRHLTRECRSKKSCLHCHTRHHTSLHGASFGRSQHQDNKKQLTNDQPSIPTTTAISSTITTENQVNLPLSATILATFTATAVNPASGKRRTCTGLVDTGCSYTYIRSSIARELELPFLHQLQMDTSGCHTSKRRMIPAYLVELDLQARDEQYALPVRALAVEHLAPPIHRPAVHLPTEVRAVLDTIPDVTNYPPSSEEDVLVDILVGNDLAQLLVGPGIPALCLRPTLSAHKTPFGTIIQGSVGSSHSEQRNATSLCGVATMRATSLLAAAQSPDEEDTVNILNRLSSLELLGIDGTVEASSANDDPLTTELLESSCRAEDGRYIVALPFKAGAESLPTNFRMAFRRAQYTHNRLSEELRIQYYAEFDKRIGEGVLEIVDGRDEPGPVIHILPHFPVYKQSSSTTKVRPVVDASSHTYRNGPSLNDLLHQGPNLLIDLAHVLLRFRLSKYAFTADIQAAFYQIAVRPRDRDALRIILPKRIHEPLNESNFQIWRFTRIVMGATSSPWILLAILQQVVEDAQKTADARDIAPQLLDDVPRSLYVDNLAMNFDDEAAGPHLTKGLQDLFHTACFHLREFSSNSLSALTSLPSTDRCTDTTVKLLGLVWDTTNDTLHLSTPTIPPPNGLTRASLASGVAKLYDPVGFAAPLLLGGRLLLRRAFKNNDPWHKPADPDTVQQWRNLREDFLAIKSLTIPRQCIANRLNQIRMVIFSDASLEAYGVAAYLWQREKDIMSGRLVFAKARLAPSSKSFTVTVPRLELLAALLATRVALFLRTAYRNKLSIISTTHYIDSQIVLHWLRRPPKTRLFEQRRIREIMESKVETEHRYIPSSLNPADHCTKPLTLYQLQRSQFHEGPPFFSTPYEAWPQWQLDPRPPESLPSLDEGNTVKTTTMTNEAKIDNQLAPFGLDMKRFSTLSRLLNTTTYAQRFVTRSGRQKGLPKFEEKRAALIKWTKYVQQTEYESVIEAFNSGKRKRCKLIQHLDLFQDEEGIIRLDGRMSQAPMTREAKYPMLLPNKHYLTHLLILHIHTSENHCTAATTLKILRNEYWITHGLTAVSTVTRKCIKCRLSKGKTQKPPHHGQLPRERLQDRVPAFSALLIDQLGPLYIFEGTQRKQRKRWVLVMTCTVTRAIHLELLNDYSAEAVVHAFERFWARRGLTKSTIYLDQATAFTGTAKLLESVMNPTFQEKIYSDLQPLTAHKRLVFKLAPVKAPWHQGAVERMVALAKNSLRPMLWKQRLNEEELRTIITKIEATLNQRPLTAMSSDHKDMTPLTPAHFISPNADLQSPSWTEVKIPAKGTKMGDLLRHNYRQRVRLLDTFWERWRTEYLQHLRMIHLKDRRTNKGRQLRPRLGSLNLLTDRTPRDNWKLCRITRLHTDKYGVVRYVTVKTANGRESQRSISHLVPLELDDEWEADDDEIPNRDNEEELSPRARRAARRNKIRDGLHGL